jgi:hypothetical protein
VRAFLAIGLILAGCKSEGPAKIVSPADGASDDEIALVGDTASDTADPGPEPASEDKPSDALTAPTPPWTAEEAAAQMDTLLAQDWPSPAHIRDTYLSAMAHGDVTCPGDSEEMVSPSTAMEGCTADSGWSYQGNAVYSAMGTPGEDDMVSWWLSADFRITSPEGHAFTGGGGVLMSVFDGTASGATYQAEIYGTWRDTGQDGWLGTGLSSIFTAGVSGTGDTQQIELDGGLGTDAGHLFFSSVTIGGLDCDGLTGRIGLNDGLGYWYWVDIDCGSCGPMTYAGQPVGDACLSLDHLPADIVSAVTAL